MEVAREAVQKVSMGLKVPVALHVCGNVNRIFGELLRWEGIRMLSHAFMGDGSLDILDFSELRKSDKMLGLGCIDTKSTRVEEISEINELIKRALKRLPAERIAIHPDCGLRTLPREIALEKLKRMVIASREALC
jgi:5-methyltetrahydropteroyltriglutamate--homocysteine methyltransferase